MTTYQERAEKYVREKLPELMKLKWGCRVKCWGRLGDVALSIYNADELQSFGVQFIDNTTNPLRHTWVNKDELPTVEIIGHPILLNHWMQVLPEKSRYFTYDNNKEIVVIGGITFNLTTGQPATEADYKKFCEIVGINQD